MVSKTFGLLTDASARRIWVLALPTLVYNLLEMTLGMADLIMVRSFGHEATAAMGLIRQITFLVEATAMAVSAGVVTLISQGIARGDARQVGDTVRQSLVLMGAISLSLAILGFFISVPLLRLLLATPDTIAYGAPYLRVYFLTVAFLGVNSVAAAVFRGAKKPMTPLRVAVLMSLINIPLNFVFIHGVGAFEGYGVMGAAIGTALARAIATAIFVALLLRNTDLIQLRIAFDRTLIEFGMIRRILKIGAPLAVAGLYRNGARILFLGVVGLSTFGAVFHAAVSVGLQVRLLAVLPALAFQVATATLVGEAIGKGDPDEAASIARRSWLLLGVCMAVMTVGIVVFAGPIAAVFVTGDETITLTVQVIQWFSVGQFFSALAIGVQGALSGAGDTRPVMRYTLISQWGILLLLAYVLLWAGVDPLGPLIAWTVAPTVMLLQVALRWRTGIWRNTTV